MFWDATLQGLKMLADWQTYVAAIICLMIGAVPTLLRGWMVERSEEPRWMLLTLLSPFFSSLGLVTMTMALAPVLFGFSDEADWLTAWKLLQHSPLAFVLLVTIVVAFSVVLLFVPLVGRMATLHGFIQGGIVLIFLLKMMEKFIPGMPEVDYVPGWWFCVGILALSAMISLVGIYFVTGILAVIFREQQHHAKLLMYPIATVFSFIPVFIYGAWLGAQIRGGF